MKLSVLTDEIQAYADAFQSGNNILKSRQYSVLHSLLAKLPEELLEKQEQEIIKEKKKKIK